VTTELDDLDVLAGFFRADPFLHLYALGDLDDFFRPHARWWGWTEALDVRVGGLGGELREVVLLYDPGTLPVLLAFTRDADRMTELLVEMRDRLPARFYAHLSPGLEAALAGRFQLESRGRHLRMGLIDDARLPAEGVLTPRMAEAGDDPTRRTAGAATLSALSRVHLHEVAEFFAVSYPGNWFDPRMLDTGQYLGAWIDGCLCAVAGVHVYSEAYRVAALGNIATRPEHRGKGLAGLVTGALCRKLRRGVDWIGLNVHAENAAAIACYRRLGFARVADYGEFMVERDPCVAAPPTRGVESR
jgi:RimJ/RimL family protein N-acetyltransferase